MLQLDVAVDLREGLHGFVADLFREARRHMTLLVAFTLFGILADPVFLHVNLHFFLQSFVIFTLNTDVVDFILSVPLWALSFY